MNHISIEGMDGVGKSTVCKLLSERLDYEFVEKPLHFLFDRDENSFDEYLRIRDKVNINPNRNFTSWFYGLGSLYMYEMFKNKNIITDRHLVSNYAWSGTENNGDVYELLLKKLGKPRLTVVLYAKPETIQGRLSGRDDKDPDLKKIQKSEEIYHKMRTFCEEHDFNTLWIHTDHLSSEQIADIIIRHLEKLDEGAPSSFKEVSMTEGQ